MWSPKWPSGCSVEPSVCLLLDVLRPSQNSNPVEPRAWEQETQILAEGHWEWWKRASFTFIPYFLSPYGLIIGDTEPDISHWIHIWGTTSQTYKMSLSWHHGWVFIRQSHCYTRPAATGYVIYGRVRESYDCAHCYTSFIKHKSFSGNMMRVPRGYNGNSFRWYGRGTRKINSLAKGLIPIIMSCCLPSLSPPPTPLE